MFSLQFAVAFHERQKGLWRVSLHNPSRHTDILITLHTKNEVKHNHKAQASWQGWASTLLYQLQAISRLARMSKRTLVAPESLFPPLLSHSRVGQTQISHVAKLLFASRGWCRCEVEAEEGQTAPNPAESPQKAPVPETFRQRPVRIPLWACEKVVFPFSVSMKQSNICISQIVLC